MASERGIDAPRAVLVLNKVDKVSRERRGDLMKIVEGVALPAGGLDDFERVFPVSALTGAGTRALLDDLMSHAPTSPWEFDSSRTTDMTDARRALEIVHARASTIASIETFRTASTSRTCRGKISETATRA